MLVGSGWRCGQCRPGRLAASVWDSVVWCGISVGFGGLGPLNRLVRTHSTTPLELFRLAPSQPSPHPILRLVRRQDLAPKVRILHIDLLAIGNKRNLGEAGAEAGGSAWHEQDPTWTGGASVRAVGTGSEGQQQ